MPSAPPGGDVPGPFAALPDNQRPREYRLVRDADGLQVRIWFTLTADSPWFDGHFPGRPVLPGVAQVHLAAHAARRSFFADRPEHHLLGTRRLKFQRPALPGDALLLSLRANALPATSVRFTLEADGDTACSGSLLYAADE